MKILHTQAEIEAAALCLLPALDGLTIAQAIVVLRRAEEALTQSTAFDAASEAVRRRREDVARALDRDE